MIYLQAEEARIAEEAQQRREEEEILRGQITPSCSSTDNGLPEPLFEEEVFEEEVRPHDVSQVEEILRLEREIEGLRRQKETREQSLNAHSLARLQRMRDKELLRLEEEACRAAQQFLSSLNFHEIDECVRNIESSLTLEATEQGRQRGEEEEEVDEGLGADEEGFKDSPNPSEHGHSDGQRTSGIRTSDDSSEEDPYANDRMPPPPAPPTNLPSAYHMPPCSREAAFCRSQQQEEEDGVELIPPNEDSDYDADDYDEGGINMPPSMPLCVPQSGRWSHDHRSSLATSTSASSGAYRFSSEGAQSSVSIHILIQNNACTAGQKKSCYYY